jgi:outer membrane cobalamin receptor
MPFDPLGAHAQERDGAEAAAWSQDLGTVPVRDTVAAEEPAPLRSVQVVRPAERALEGKDASEIVGREANVLVLDAGGPGQRRAVLLRGANSQQVAVLVDGVALNPAFGLGNDLSWVPVEALQRIEIHEGAGGAWFGAGAVGGAVNLVPGAPSLGKGARVGLSGGSWGTLEARASAVQGSERGGVQVFLNHLQSQGDFPYVSVNQQARTRRNNDARVEVAGLSARAFLGESGEAAAFLLHQSAQRGVAGLEQFPTEDARQGEERLLALASGRLEQGWGHSRLQGFFLRQDYHYTNPEPYVYGPADTRDREWRAGGSLEQGLEAWRFKGLLRLETAREQVDARTGQSAIRRGRTPLDLLASLEADLGWGAFGTIAVRGQYLSPFGAWASPSLELGWRLSPWLQLLATAGRGLRWPSLSELYYDQGPLRGNPDLKPEDAWSLEGGVRLELAWLAAEVRAFASRIDDLILFLPKTAYQIEAGNVDAVEDLGGTARLTLTPRSWLRLDLAYRYERALSGRDRLPVPFKPRHQATLRLEAGGRFKAYLEGVAMGGFFLDRFGNQREERRVLADVGVRARLWRGFALFATARNLGDKRDAVDYLLTPLPGRAFIVGVEQELNQ